MGHADWKKSCVPRVYRIATTMQATVSAARVARMASTRSSDRISMIYLSSQPNRLRRLQIPFDIQKSTVICNWKGWAPVPRLNREESQARTRNLLIEAARNEIVKK